MIRGGVIAFIYSSTGAPFRGVSFSDRKSFQGIIFGGIINFGISIFKWNLLGYFILICLGTKSSTVQQSVHFDINYNF